MLNRAFLITQISSLEAELEAIQAKIDKAQEELLSPSNIAFSSEEARKFLDSKRKSRAELEKLNQQQIEKIREREDLQQKLETGPSSGVIVRSLSQCEQSAPEKYTPRPVDVKMYLEKSDRFLNNNDHLLRTKILATRKKFPTKRLILGAIIGSVFAATLPISGPIVAAAVLGFAFLGALVTYVVSKMIEQINKYQLTQLKIQSKLNEHKRSKELVVQSTYAKLHGTVGIQIHTPVDKPTEAIQQPCFSISKAPALSTVTESPLENTPPKLRL